MGVERFDVLLRGANGATVKREWSKVDLLRSVAWLKRMNARGNNVFVRPSGEHGLVLLDSINAENLANLRSKGFAPAISIEVTGNEFQAWVRLSNHALPGRIRRVAEAGLASAFGDTGNRLVRDGYGWLAGCANHGDGPKGHHRGKYVLAHTGSVEIGQQAKAYVLHVMKAFDGLSKDPESKSQVQPLPIHAKERTRGR